MLTVPFLPVVLGVAFHIPSLFIHLDIEFSLQALRHIMEMLLAVEHKPKESLLVLAFRILHHGVVAFPPG